jgi:hypothetical protein
MDRLCHPDGSLNSIAAQLRNQQKQLGNARSTLLLRNEFYATSGLDIQSQSKQESEHHI